MWEIEELEGKIHQQNSSSGKKTTGRYRKKQTNRSNTTRNDKKAIPQMLHLTTHCADVPRSFQPRSIWTVKNIATCGHVKPLRCIIYRHNNKKILDASIQQIWLNTIMMVILGVFSPIHRPKFIHWSPCLALTLGWPSSEHNQKSQAAMLALPVHA